MITLEPVSLSVGLAGGFFIGGLIGIFIHVWRNAALKAQLDHIMKDRAGLENAFHTLARDALQASNEQFLNLAQEKLRAAQQDGAHDLEMKNKAVSDLVDPISKTLKEMENKIETLGKAGSGIESQLRTFAEDQRLLRQETQNLVRTLRNPATRGRWGEMQFQRTLEMIGLVEGTHYRQQQSVMDSGSRRQADFVIGVPGGMEIVIDVKAPIEPYWDAMEHAQDEASREQALKTFRQAIRDHLKALSAKEYWRQFNAPEFVVMFLPTEGLYAMAVNHDPSLIEDAARQNVILASPTTIMGLLRVVVYGWQQQSVAEEARTISALASELYRRISTFGEHIQKIGQNLSRATGAYNQAVGSLESSVLPSARRLRELHVQTGHKEIPVLAPLEDSVRHIASPELLRGETTPQDPQEDSPPEGLARRQGKG